MRRQLKTSLLLLSALYILLGICLMLYPQMSLNLLCYGVGGVLLLCGVGCVCRYLFGERSFFFSQMLLLVGILLVCVGAFFLMRPDIIENVLPMVFGLYIMFDGLVRFSDCWALHRAGYPGWWKLLGLVALSIGLGALMVFDPFETASAMVMAVGVILLIEGAVNLCSALFTGIMLRRLTRLAEKLMAQTEAEQLSAPGVVVEGEVLSEDAAPEAAPGPDGDSD